LFHNLQILLHLNQRHFKGNWKICLRIKNCALLSILRNIRDTDTKKKQINLTNNGYVENVYLHTLFFVTQRIPGHKYSVCLWIYYKKSNINFQDSQ